MSKIVKILKSDDLESQERNVERIKKEITSLNETLEINLEVLEKLRTRSRDELTC
ncbi:MAG TPA: hypothetical protein VJL33_03085 [Candidatus Bathyarchaeia archaeon]|nr:hypothetical protein [Candidatus Bathyarchaeia archaeon]